MASGGLPNDYYIPNISLIDQEEGANYDDVTDRIRNTYLDLIDAPCAWEITPGDSTVLVGVADSKIMMDHEDLEGKMEVMLGNSTIPAHTHGTGVAGLIAGNTNNERGTASIGRRTKMVGIPSAGYYTEVRDLAIWSHNNDDQVKVINMSWGQRFNYNNEDEEKTVAYQIEKRDILRRMYKCINEEYNIVLVAAGHNRNMNNPYYHPNDRVSFPAYWESTIAVTSVGHAYDWEDWVSGPANLKDVLFKWSADDGTGYNYTTNLLYDQIDIAAPGYNMYRPTTGGTNMYIGGGQTSHAAPIVSGTVALMFAANPNLSALQVKDILKYTADRIDTIPPNQQYFGEGNNKLSNPLGRINAYKAVKMAKYFDEYGYDLDAMPRKVDLMIRDNEEDIGEEPNNTTDILWNSPDIWVRNQPDGIEQHQNAKFNLGIPNYVYVRIKNNGCDPTSGKDKVKLYWTKAASSMSWDEDYLGQKYYENTNALQGDTINTVKIPSLKPGEETVLEIPWANVPDPEDYLSVNDNPWHFCLLARIESDDDPMTFPETNSVQYNDRYNNNIASKNLTVINLNPGNIGEDLGGGFGFQNPSTSVDVFDLVLKPDTYEIGKLIFNEAEVRVVLDETLKQAWEAGGEQSTDIVKLNDGSFLITGEDAKLKNIQLAPREFGVVYIDFHFLTQEITEKTTYLYHAIQQESSTKKVLGGESYEINKSPRPLFFAEIHKNSNVDKGDDLLVEANSINEPAVYNWYDNEGNLIFEGIDFSTSAEIGKQYKLEVIALADGYKDYAEVQINYKPNRIISISPNPTSQEVFVEYKINEGESAYLAFTSIENPNQSDNYILNIEETEQTIDLSSLSVGMYSMALVVNGQIVDSKNLIKE